MLFPRVFCSAVLLGFGVALIDLALLAETTLFLHIIMQALHQEILPPSGVEYATTLKLTPATLAEFAIPSTSTSHPHPSQGALYNVVVARANILRIFEVTENPAPISSLHQGRRAELLRGTEAVEGEVEMDGQGEGFVNMGSVKVTLNIYVDDSPLPNDSHFPLLFSPNSCTWTSIQLNHSPQFASSGQPPTVIRFHFIREHRLHGTVTGLESIRIMSSFEDRLDRLLVSFKDAKVG